MNYFPSTNETAENYRIYLNNKLSAKGQMNLLDFNNHIWHLLLITPGKAKHDAATPGWPAMMSRPVTKCSKHDLPSPRAGMQEMEVQPMGAYTSLCFPSRCLSFLSKPGRKKASMTAFLRRASFVSCC